MLAALPLDALDPSLLTLGPFHTDRGGRVMAPLSYPAFTNVSIITPPLQVLQYDSVLLRLSLDLREGGAALHALQERLQTFVPAPLLPLVQKGANNASTGVGRASGSGVGRALMLFTSPSPTVQCLDGTLAPLRQGQLIRCAVQLHGLYPHSDTYRIQHSVAKIWAVD